MGNSDYVTEYYRTITNLNDDLEKRAIREIMAFDKEIDILAIMAHDLNVDKEDADALDAAYDNCEYTNIETKDRDKVNCAILGVRYNKNEHIIEALLKEYDDIVNEWVNINELYSDDRIPVYITILEYIDQAKELCS